MSDKFVEAITPREENFSRWYTDVVLKAQLADYAPVRGCIVVRPPGFAIWEAIQSGLDRRFKETGVQNAYFPLLIPESIFTREAEHIEGFAPEVPWVTHAGEEELQERLAVRPSSETIIGTMFSRWIQSYRDLPMLVNQWCNVLRWEKATHPFLRTTEFLWQEGHTCHETEDEARERSIQMLKVYREFMEEVLAIPVIAGIKSEREKFAGAVETYTVEAMMQDGRALQAGTSHYLGDGFAKVLDIQFLGREGELEYVHQTSWGVSHRLIGALIMVHGDDRGLVLPPRVAPNQAVVVPIYRDDSRDRVLDAARALRAELREDGFRIHLDDREEYTPGWKFNEWEMRGVPVRVELGPRDLDSDQVMLVRRDTGEKEPVSRADLAPRLKELLAEIQEGLYLRALNFRRENTYTAKSIEEIEKIMEAGRGFVEAGWCGDDACEAKIKEQTGTTIRCIPFEESAEMGTCPACGRPGRHHAIFARAY
ncbi:MAG: proline--tRNA ligase [Bacillota bacterium]